MIKCTACGTENLQGSQFCDECGSPLKTAEKKEFASSSPRLYEAPKINSASVTSLGIPAIVDEPRVENHSLGGENGRKSKGAHARLVIERGAAIGTEFELSADESNIGRWDADNGIFPDVDLDAHDPEAKVSRRHARICRDREKYVIEDLGSTNGTFVNRGKRLLPGNRHLLDDGDEIIVGKTFMRFHKI